MRRRTGYDSNLNLNGAPGEIRTPDLLVRSQTLYPTELRARGWMPLCGRAIYHSIDPIWARIRLTPQADPCDPGGGIAAAGRASVKSRIVNPNYLIYRP